MTRVPHVRWFGKAPATDAIPIPSIAGCLLAMSKVKAALTCVGFGRTLRWINRSVSHRSMLPSIETEYVVACEYAVAMAAAFFPFRALCLERSLTLLYVARGIGIPVTYHHGVRPLPLEAHAWVQYGGKVINDVSEKIDGFAPFPQVYP